MIGGVVTYRLPRQYQATATLWALHKYDTLTATSIDYTNLDTPANTQATALTELVQSRTFSLAVAREALLAEMHGSQMGASLASQIPIVATQISQHTQVYAQGYDLFIISYTTTDPQLAQQVVAAVIDNYGQQSQLVVATDEQNLLNTYQTELNQANLDVQNAVAAQSQYFQSHSQLPYSQLQDDPIYQQLQAQTRQVQLNLQNIQASIDTLKQNIATHRIIAASLYKVLDQPVAPSQPVDRKRTILLGTAAGLALGLIASVLFIALMMGRDRRVYTSLDLHKVTTYPVVMELPFVSVETVSILVTTAEEHPALLLKNNNR